MKITNFDINVGDICIIDMNNSIIHDKILLNDIKKIVRQGNSKVKIDDIDDEFATVSSYDSTLGGIIKSAIVPIDCLKKISPAGLRYAESVFKTKTIRDIVGKKTGLFWKKGETVYIKWDKDNDQKAYLLNEDLEKIVITNTILHLYVNGITRPPSLNSLNKMSENGIAKSVTGERVELDGHDKYGSPSWMLVLEMV